MNLLQTKLKKCFKNGPFRCLKTGNICETYDFFSLDKRTMWNMKYTFQMFLGDFMDYQIINKVACL